jgi:hypothetical protein
MATRAQGEEQSGIPFLVRETADGFVTLVAAHFKVANLELVADLHSRTSRLAVQLAIGVVALIGYVLVMVGVALTAVPWVERSQAFLLLGGVHFAAALVAGTVIGLKHRRVSRGGGVIDSMSRSVTSVADAVMPAPLPAQAQREAHGRA